jgi:hypothetical protein
MDRRLLVDTAAARHAKPRLKRAIFLSLIGFPLWFCEGADGAVDRMLLPAQSQAAALAVFRVTDKDTRGPTTWPRQPRGFVLRFPLSTAIY